MMDRKDCLEKLKSFQSDIQFILSPLNEVKGNWRKFNLSKEKIQKLRERVDKVRLEIKSESLRTHDSSLATEQSRLEKKLYGEICFDIFQHLKNIKVEEHCGYWYKHLLVAEEIVTFYVREVFNGNEVEE